MKPIQHLALLALLTLSLTHSSALAQSRPGGPRGPRPDGAGGPPPPGERAGGRNPARVVEHLTAAFASIAPYDANRDGQLDQAEMEVLAQAVADGKVQHPAHRSPPPGVEIDPAQMLRRVSSMYATVAAYDVNRDGVLDETEQGALKAAIASGEVTLPGGPRGGRGPGPHRPAGPRE